MSFQCSQWQAAPAPIVTAQFEVKTALSFLCSDTNLTSTMMQFCLGSIAPILKRALFWPNQPSRSSMGAGCGSPWGLWSIALFWNGFEVALRLTVQAPRELRHCRYFRKNASSQARERHTNSSQLPN